MVHAYTPCFSEYKPVASDMGLQQAVMRACCTQAKTKLKVKTKLKTGRPLTGRQRRNTSAARPVPQAALPHINPQAIPIAGLLPDAAHLPAHAAFPLGTTQGRATAAPSTLRDMYTDVTDVNLLDRASRQNSVINHAGEASACSDETSSRSGDRYDTGNRPFHPTPPTASASLGGQQPMQLITINRKGEQTSYLVPPTTGPKLAAMPTLEATPHAPTCAVPGLIAPGTHQPVAIDAPPAFNTVTVVGGEGVASLGSRQTVGQDLAGQLRNLQRQAVTSQQKDALVQQMMAWLQTHGSGGFPQPDDSREPVPAAAGVLPPHSTTAFVFRGILVMLAAY